MKWNSKLNRQYTQISLYVIGTAVIIYVLSLVAKNAPAILSDIMGRISWIMKVVKPVVLGFVIAYLLDPVVSFFERHLKKRKFFRKREKKIRSYAVLLTVLLVILGFATLITILIYSVTKQIRLANFEDIVILVNTYVDTLTEFINRLTRSIQEWNLNIDSKELNEIAGNISSTVINMVQSATLATVDSMSNFTGVVTTFVFSAIIGIWFMIDGSMITSYLNKIMYALASKKTNDRVHSFLTDADEVFSGYIRGQLMDALVMMALIGLSLSLVGIKFSVLIGIIAGIGNLVPYLGPFIAYGGTAIVCLINGDFNKLIVAIIVLFVIQTIDGNFIGPKLLSSSIEVHPLLVIVSLIFGSAIGGFLGMLLAVPVGALIKLLFVRFIDNRIKKKEAEHIMNEEHKITSN